MDQSIGTYTIRPDGSQYGTDTDFRSAAGRDSYVETDFNTSLSDTSDASSTSGTSGATLVYSSTQTTESSLKK